MSGDERKVRFPQDSRSRETALLKARSTVAENGSARVSSKGICKVSKFQEDVPLYEEPNTIYRSEYLNVFHYKHDALVGSRISCDLSFQKERDVRFFDQ